MAGTAAKPTDRRQPHSCILDVPALMKQQASGEARDVLAQAVIMHGMRLRQCCCLPLQACMQLSHVIVKVLDTGLQKLSRRDRVSYDQKQ